MANDKRVSSRLAGFYKLPIAKRRKHLTDSGLLSQPCDEWLNAGGGLDVNIADRMSENVVSSTGLPLGLALNFRINQRDYLVPMAVEEPSIVAAASNAARLVRVSGGFSGEADQPVMTAQVQFDDVEDPKASAARVEAQKQAVLDTANAAIPRMVARGGGCVDIEARAIADDLLVVHLYVNVGDAMGANIVDTVAEATAPLLHDIVGGRLGLRILSNLPMRRLVRVTGCVSADALGGDELADGIVRASRFASCDPLRAATHNKGVMNGIDAVAVALGQDWRAIEAGAHAYAAMSGQYRPIATWTRTPEGIRGVLEMPLAAGTVGGATRVHPGAKTSFEILAVSNARELAIVMACVGLASNLAALKALAGEGIQRGHMKLHRRRFANANATEADRHKESSRDA